MTSSDFSAQARTWRSWSTSRRYQRFLANPQPAERWVMPPGRKLPRKHPLCAGPLSPSNSRQALVVVNVLFSWFVQAGYLAGNPLYLARHRHSKNAPRPTRLLDAELWGVVKATVNAMPVDTSRERATHARARWVFSLFFLCGLRISEIVGNTMDDFFNRADRSGEELWWLEILGKGEGIMAENVRHEQRKVPAQAIRRLGR